MSEGYPSMAALLGLLAVAGYQNRDKISAWLGAPARDAHGPVVPPVSRTTPATGASMPSNLERVFGGFGFQPIAAKHLSAGAARGDDRG